MMNQISRRTLAALLCCLLLASCAGAGEGARTADAGEPGMTASSSRTAEGSAEEENEANDGSGQNEVPAGTPVEEPAEDRADDAPPVQEEPADEAPAEAPAEAAPMTTEEALAAAMACIDQPVSVLYEKIGEPSDADYAPSCLGGGEDGNLYYDGFTVYTYRENGEETIRDVD